MKHLKSSSQDLRDLFEDSITVRHVAEKLQSCQADEDASVVRRRMDQLDFDVLGIEDKGVVYGYVGRLSLESGPCRRYQRPFQPRELIAESMPLIDLLPVLRAAPHRAFVQDRKRVTGIVTWGDLQKIPMRMLLFGLVSLLEMQLLRIVKDFYPGDSWHRSLNGKRLEKAKKLKAERQAKNEALDLADYLQFCDKKELILKKPPILDCIGFNSSEAKKHLRQLLKSAENIRNKLAHAQDIVTGSSWPELIDLARKMEALLEKCEQTKNE
ncbi:MAG: hypothetical protein HY664_04105 [Chloroflexi bacterium]|nr:hypothetical protein [Chloroflexota bacterium]